MTPFRERNKTVIGAIGMGLILLLLVGAFKSDALPFVGGGKVYKADFSEAAGLQKMDEVRVAGVKVGKVVGIKLENDHVVVEMRLKGVQLGRLTRAEIKIKTVLGRKYIAVEPDGDGELDPDTHIPVSRTKAPYDISPAFQELAQTVGQIDTEQLARSFTTMADAFRDTPNEVRASLNGLSRLSQTIASRDAQLRVLLDRANGVTRILADRDDDLMTFLKDTDLVLQEVRARRAAIHKLLVSTTELSQQLIALVRENRAALDPALTHLRNVVDVLRKNQANLDRSLAEMAPFVRLFANNLGNGRWFDTYVYNLTNPSGFGPGTFP